MESAARGTTERKPSDPRALAATEPAAGADGSESWNREADIPDEVFFRAMEATM